MDNLISKEQAIDKIKKRLFETAFNNVGIKQNIDETLVDVAENRLENWFDELPSVQPESTRTFVELVVEYPDPELCTYKEYKGKPYYSIKYIENGETYIGYGTYNPEVLSQYLKEYFILSAQPERKTGYWIQDRSGSYCCSNCMEPCASYVMMKPRDKFCKMCGSRNEVME